ncbi:MAG: FxLYD domain-containing protein [Candidatus Poribacteria bacterium]|nr:FxLYD domain-containing protein [Candidatus Poribacteria bacterium]
MNSHLRILTAIAFTLILIAGITGCSSDEENSITTNPVAADASDEESSVRYGLADTYDNVRNGARLVISYDAATDAFTGTVTNTTGAILTQVRVEVHLYDGAVTVDELGPTPNVDLQPGESHSVTLPVGGHSFTEWVAHPEVGPSSGGGGEGGEGGNEGGNEHGPGGEGGGGG